MNAGAHHGGPHRCRLGRRDAAARARGRAHARDPRRGHPGAARTSRRCAPCATSSACVVWSRTPGRARELDGVEEVGTAEEAVRGADVVVHRDLGAEPIVERAWLKPGAHVNAVGSSIPTTRELDTATMAAASLFVDRRESTVNEAGDYPVPACARARSGPSTSEAELGEVLIGAVEGRRSADELTVFKSLGLAVEDLAAAEHVLAARRGGGRRARSSRCDRDRGDPPRPRGDRRASPCARRSCGSTSTPTRDLAQARDAAAGATRSRSAAPATRCCRRPTSELAGGVLTASAGNMAQGVRYAARLRGVPATIVVPDHAPETKLDGDRALRRHA